jgi:transcriptional regulator with XRE-family HTH domain
MADHPLKIAREKRGISQCKLGMLTGVHSSKISDIENWRRYPCEAWKTKLSQYFGIPDYELFPKTEDLLDVIRQLTEENTKLKAMISGRGTPLAHRDNTRFL